jgi:hypothetical protein
LVVNGELIAFAPSGLTSYRIPNSVTVIGNRAFEHCRNLTNVTIPYSVTTIGESAFYGCIGLMNLILPNSIKTIKKYAFDSCIRLKNLAIPSCTKVEYDEHESIWNTIQRAMATLHKL